MVAQNDGIFKINISSYTRWQKPTERAKEWVSLSTSFFDDRAIVGLMADCPDAVFCFMWLVMNADNEGLIIIKGTHLKRNLMRAIGLQGNRFDFLKRLELLSNSGLINFQSDSKDGLNHSQKVSKQVLKDFQSVSNTPLEKPQTQAPTDPLTTTITTTINNNPPTPQRGGGEILKKEKPKPKEAHLALAALMAEKVKETVPLAKIPENLDSWADTIRLIVEVDKIPLPDVESVFLWANKDTFWYKNILCPNSLRRQMGRLDAKKTEEAAKLKATAKDTKPYAVKLLDYPRVKNRFTGLVYRTDDVLVDPTCKIFGNKGSLTVKATGETMSAEEWDGVA